MMPKCVNCCCSSGSCHSQECSDGPRDKADCVDAPEAELADSRVPSWEEGLGQVGVQLAVREEVVPCRKM
jgi:hypothetical protein